MIHQLRTYTGAGENPSSFPLCDSLSGSVLLAVLLTEYGWSVGMATGLKVVFPEIIETKR